MTTMLTWFALIIISPCLSFLITQHFTHSILFILDCIVCYMGVWVSLIHFPEKQWFSSKLWAIPWQRCTLALSPTSFSIALCPQIWLTKWLPLVINKDREPYPEDSGLHYLGIRAFIFVFHHPLVISLVRWVWEMLSFSNLGLWGRDTGCRGLGWHSDPLFDGSFADHWDDMEQYTHRCHRLSFNRLGTVLSKGYYYLKIQLILHFGSLILKYHQAASH